MSLHTFPITAPAAPPSSPPDDAPTVNLWFLRRELGCTGYQAQRMVKYVTALIAGHGFPPPLPRYRLRADQLVRTVTADSVWRRDAVEAWFADFLPPDAAAALDRADRAAAAADMDARAGHLRLVGGSRP